MKCGDCKHCHPFQLPKDGKADAILKPAQKARLEARGHCHRFPPVFGGWPLVNLDGEGCAEGSA